MSDLLRPLRAPKRALTLCTLLAACGGAAPDTAPRLAGGAAQPVPAGGSAVASPTDVTAFRGSPADAGALGLRTFGFEPAGRQGGADIWRNRASGACAAVVTAGGRFAEITMVPPASC